MTDIVKARVNGREYQLVNGELCYTRTEGGHWYCAATADDLQAYNSLRRLERSIDLEEAQKQIIDLKERLELADAERAFFEREIYRLHDALDVACERQMQ